MRVVITQLFYLDTKYRSAGTIGSPEFTFPNNLIVVKPNEKIRLTLSELSMEYTFFQTDTFNNSFVLHEAVLDENGEEMSHARCLKLPPGNHDMQTLMTEIHDLLNQADGLYWYSVTLQRCTNTLKFRATIQDTDHQPLQFRFIFNQEEAGPLVQSVNLQESCNELLGFKEDSINVSDALCLESTIPCTMSGGIENIFIHIANSCNNFGNLPKKNTFTRSNVLAKIPVSQPPYSTIYYFDVNGTFSTIIANQYLDNLSLRLVNERFSAIEPKKEWTFTVKIDVLEENPDVNIKDNISKILDLNKLKFVKKNAISCSKKM